MLVLLGGQRLDHGVAAEPPCPVLEVPLGRHEEGEALQAVRRQVGHGRHVQAEVLEVAGTALVVDLAFEQGAGAVVAARPRLDVRRHLADPERLGAVGLVAVDGRPRVRGRVDDGAVHRRPAVADLRRGLPAGLRRVGASRSRSGASRGPSPRSRRRLDHDVAARRARGDEHHPHGHDGQPAPGPTATPTDAHATDSSGRRAIRYQRASRAWRGRTLARTTDAAGQRVNDVAIPLIRRISPAGRTPWSSRGPCTGCRGWTGHDRRAVSRSPSAATSSADSHAIEG